MEISIELWNEMIKQLSDELPREGVGVIIQQGTTMRFVPLQNTAQDEAHFCVNPAEWVSLLSRLEREEELVAVVHSHPTTPPIPSEEDVEGFPFPGCKMLIFSFQDRNNPSAALYRKEGTDLYQERLTVRP